MAKRHEPKKIDSHALDKYISIDAKRLLDACEGLSAEKRYAYLMTVSAVIAEKLHRLTIACDEAKRQLIDEARASGQKTISTDFVRMSLRDDPSVLDLALFRSDFSDFGPTIGRLVLSGVIPLSQKDILAVIDEVKTMRPSFIPMTAEEKMNEYLIRPAQKGTGACVIKPVDEFLPESLEE